MKKTGKGASCFKVYNEAGMKLPQEEEDFTLGKS